MIGRQQRRAFGGNMFDAFGAQPIDRLDQHPGHEAQQKLRHQPVDIDGDQRIQQRGQAEQGRNRQPGAECSGRPQRTHHHEQRIENIVGCNDPGALLRGAANLHQRVKRHDEEAAENTEHHQVKKHSPDRRNAEQRQQLVRAVTDQPDRRGEIEINTEQRQANRAERHQADFDMLARHPLAEQRTEADTHRENGEQHRHRRLAAAEHILGIGRELGEKERAVQPEPRNTENGQKHRPIAAGEIDVMPGFGNGIEVDL